MGDLNAGFGEDLAPEEVVRMHERLAYHFANRMHEDHAPVEDLVQEGRIILWSIARRRPGEDLRGGLASTAIRRRMQECVIRETWTGHTRKPGEEHRPKRSMVGSIEELLGEGDWTPRELAEEEAGLDAAEWGYHHGEVLDALRALTDRQRRYVYRRFWLLDTQAEIAADEGRSKSAVQHEWQDIIRPVLVSKLGHLVHA